MPVVPGFLLAISRNRRQPPNAGDGPSQENGYFVLRFLAEDVGKDLDAVVDAILRVLAQGAARLRRPSLSTSSGEAINEIAYRLVGLGTS